MRFLIDESAGIGVMEYLRTAGPHVLAAAELSPEIDDEIVRAWAVRETRILVTNDKDFGELVFRSGQPHRGILLFRLQDESTANRIKVVEATLQNYAERLADHFVVVTETSIRVRPLESP